MARKWSVYIAAGTLVAIGGCYEREDPEGVLSGGTESGADDQGSDDNGDETDGGNDGNDDGDSADDTTGTGNDSGDPTGDTNDTSSDPGNLNELIGTLCAWDFQCCSEGEIDYRLGPFTVDEADCTERFIEQLNSNDNEDAETPRGDLLYVLGFAVRLDRSEPNQQMVDEQPLRPAEHVHRQAEGRRSV
jgi:hypothetical protein